MKYLKAIQKNEDTINSRIMRDKASSALLFGNTPVAFYPVRGVRLTTVDEQKTGFHLIGLLHINNNNVAFCAELRKEGIDCFWVTGKGRVSMKDDLAGPYNYALDQMVSFDDGNCDAMIRYVLATWSMDPTWL